MDTASDRRSQRPLAGLRVIDFSRAISGPYVGRMLCDLGADVVKVEPPEGDITRSFGVVRAGISGLFLQQNAGKRNVCVDLKHPRGAALARDLAACADVLIENFRPGVMDRLGLGWASLAVANPRLVQLSISGFGTEGTDAQRQAYAPVIHAESGWVARRAELLGGPPQDSAVSFADSIASLHGLAALLAAVRMRDQTGLGQRVDVAMIDAWLATDDYVHYALDGVPIPVYQGGEVWRAPGGPLMLNAALFAAWPRLARTHGIASEEPQEADRAAKIRSRREAVQRWMLSFTDRDALCEAIARAGLVWGEVLTPTEALAAPAVAERGVIAEIDDGAHGSRRVVQSPYRFSQARSGVRGNAARLGEHNAEVLAEWLDLSAGTAESLAAEKVLLHEADAPPNSAA